MRKILLSLLLCSCFSYARANNKILNIYTWSNYIPQPVIQLFEKKTGIHVNIAEYDNNETMYAKLLANPNSGYDLVFPSSYYIQRMEKNHLLQPINKEKIPNIKYLNPALLNKNFDRNNQYSLPYVWGTTGIVVNKKYWNPKDFQTWMSLWQPKLHNQLLMLNDVRDVFAVALLRLGYSINDKNPEHIKQAYLLLKKLMPNIKLFNSDSVISTYADDDASIGMIWNGDMYLAKKTNKNLVYIFPKPAFETWIDCIALIKNAPHLNNAYQFINFINQPKIAKLIFNGIGFSPANLGAIKLLPKNIRNNPVINPPSSALKRTQFQTNLDNNTLKTYMNYWQRLKLSV